MIQKLNHPNIIKEYSCFYLQSEDKLKEHVAIIMDILSITLTEHLNKKI